MLPHPAGRGALGAAAFFHLALEWLPVDAVPLLLGPHLGIQRLAQAGEVLLDGKREERSSGHHCGGFAREASGKVNETILCTRLPKPKFYAARIWFACVLVKMALY